MCECVCGLVPKKQKWPLLLRDAHGFLFVCRVYLILSSEKYMMFISIHAASFADLLSLHTRIHTEYRSHMHVFCSANTLVLSLLHMKIYVLEFVVIKWYQT